VHKKVNCKILNQKHKRNVSAVKTLRLIH